VTSAATYYATDAATSAAARAATRAATWDATDAATSAATKDATRAAIIAAIRASTPAAIDAATDAASTAATYDASHVATAAAIKAATDAATAAAAMDATSTAPRARAMSAVVAFLVRGTGYWSHVHQGGNQSSGWSAYLSFFRHVAKLPIDYSGWRHYEEASKAGPRFVHAQFWIVAALPLRIHMDARNLPHCATGPYCSWPDGFALWYWHGVRVPRQWIEDPDSVDPRLALSWDNVEQRRVLAEIIGWSRVLEQVQVRVIDEDPDPEIGTLLEADLPDAEGQRFLRVRCGTGREFVLPMPREVTTARAGQAWSYGLSEAEHKKLEVRT
jgi:hypothetical protein